MREQRKKLHVKLTLLYACFAVVVGVFISAFGYFLMFRLATDFYSEKAGQAASLAAAQVDGDTIADYAVSGETDEAYDRLREELSQIKGDMSLTYLYVFLPGETSFVYLVEAQTGSDDPSYIAALGDVYEYGEWEYQHLVPDVAAKRASKEGLLSMENPFFGVGVSAWVPVLDGGGEVAAMVEADIHLDQVLASIRSAIVLMLAVYVALIVAMVLAQSASIRRMITIPLRKLTDRTLRFAAEGQLAGFEDDITTGDELQALSEAFGQMARDIAAYTEERADLAAEQERIATELEVAADIQRSMLPGELGAFADRRYLDIRGQLHASQRMGGNFYDYFALDDHRVGVVICGMDSTGIPAAMLLVVIRTIIKSQFSGERPLADTMGEINRQVFDAMEHRQPVSAFVGVLDTREGLLTYINAGYNPPVVMRRGERYELLAGTASIPLGMERNVSYRELELKLRQGDRVLFYSNGVAGAKGRGGADYGTERLRSALQELRGGDADLDRLMDGVAASVAAFTGKSTPEHDLVLLTLEYKRGNRELARLTLPPDMGQAARLQEFLREQMGANGVTGKDYARTLVCAEELFSICCKYTLDQQVQVECAIPGSGRLELRFIADFHGEDPLSDEAGGAVKNAVAFIQEHAQRLELESVGGRTALVMSKRVASVSDAAPAKV